MEKKEAAVKNVEHGSIHIAEDVVASIAALAVAEVDGVSATPTAGGKKSSVRNVKLSVDGAKVNIDVSILVRYGYVVTTVAAKVQERIKDALINMAGLEIGSVNIHVNGVAFDKPDEKSRKK